MEGIVMFMRRRDDTRCYKTTKTYMQRLLIDLSYTSYRH